MSGWITETTKDLIDQGFLEIGDGYRAKNSEMAPEGVPFVRAGDVAGRVNTTGTDRLSFDSVAKVGRKRAMPGDVVMTTKGTIGRLAFVKSGDPEFIYSPQLCFWRSLNREVIDPRWLFFAMEGPEMLDQISWSAGQTDMAPYVSLTDQRTAFKLTLPPISEQREIASILGALDDKIELNRRMAATLEEMARALYRSWFVDFDPVKAKAEGLAPAFMDEATAALFPDRFGGDGLPDGWRRGRLSDVAINPRTGVKPEQIDPSTPYIGLEHMPRRSIQLGDWGTAEDVGSQKSAMRRGDFLFGKLRPYFHKVGISPVDGICSTDIIVVRSKTPEWASFVLSVISSDDFVEHTNAGSSGTRMPRTSWGEMSRYEVFIPPAPVASAFEAALNSMRDRIVAGVHEARNLAALRDALLPKLMSGEIRVGEARDQFEEVA